MKNFKSEKEVRNFFKSEMFKFQILCDGVVEYKTCRPIEIDGSYIDFKVGLFFEDNPFMNYDSLDNLLSVMQIFEVIAIDTSTNTTTDLYFQKFINYRNN